jgi:putative tricarboxylic transport membrane protein
MDALGLLAHGLGNALTPVNLLYCFAGVLLGQIIGALPGIGPATAIALLLPLTFGGDPTGSIILFAGIYYGAQYGGTLTSVLIAIPGESTTVMTSLDGHQLARQGRGGEALGGAAIASFIAGIVGTLGLALAAPSLAKAALAFGPPEYFALAILGLVALALVGGHPGKGVLMGLVGLGIAMTGTDPQAGNPRFIFGSMDLLDGVEFLVLAVALFGIGEILGSLENSDSGEPIGQLGPLMPDWGALRRCSGAIARGTGIGFLVGVLPGAGATVASFIAYAAEKRVSRHPEKFGTGLLEAVVAPEAANNAAASGAMVPMFALGIPGSNTTAIILGAFLMFGLHPGPQLFTQNADLVWTIFASMIVGNVVLLILNLPLAGIFARLVVVPFGLLYPGILVLCIAGIYSNTNSMSDLWLLAGFGVFGFLMRRYEYPAAPLVLGLVLAPMLENSLRQSLTLSHGDPSIFATRPISAVLIAVSAMVLLVPLAMRTLEWRRRRGLTWGALG